jgi:hypothetical protein
MTRIIFLGVLAGTLLALAMRGKDAVAQAQKGMDWRDAFLKNVG